ncbi:ROK family protein [Bacteroides sp. 51]|uniref:ROK family protein n=1 Tax=Bacteroides sp. 51 TaxID=2302938 RepID=UPI0013D89D78|nr:ROK family protein [Bacteroides sp. 51]NDV82618.1 ROK family protein [Bacteroides sp. 51]
MYTHDNRVVLTLDAGGTNFVFSAIQSNQEIVKSVVLPAHSDNLNKCLDTLVQGFNRIKSELTVKPVAISFAFPGPADYKNGIIGDLPNFSSFRGGVALGPFLEAKFRIPVFINNDGNLFAYGEALAGMLPDVNRKLEEWGSNRRYKNLLGITLGTGFGAGVVIDNILLTGDNGVGGDMWIFRNGKYPEMIAEESVSIRAVKRVYQELSSEDAEHLSPKDIYDIAEGKKEGNRQAAIRSFEELGQLAGHALSYALTIVDGLVVIGGGVSGAAKYIIPPMIKEMQKPIGTFAGLSFPAVQTEVYNLMDPEEHSQFMQEDKTMIPVPGTERKVAYNRKKSIGIAVSSLGTSKAIALGAYAFALAQLDK